MKNFMLYNSFNLISSLDFFAMIIIAFLSTILMMFVNYKLFQILQQSGYKLKRYFGWFKEAKYSYFIRLFMLTFLSTAATLLTNVLLNEFFIVKSFEYFPILFFILFSCFFITVLFSEKQKTPLKYTNRIKRLIFVDFIITFCVSFAFEILGYCFIPYLSFGLICVLPIVMPLVFLISFAITLPIEKMVSNSYIKKSEKKLQSMQKIKTIAITGSYGKTTLKNILKSILSEKYKVCASPESYNTPMGLSKTILDCLNEDDEIFIAEMGARQQGDIKKLCEMVKPNIGVITGIGNQHLASFGSLENIIKTKGELADYIEDNNGNLFISIESKNAKILSERCKNAKLVSILAQNDIKFENIETSNKGSTFTINYNGDCENVKTTLIGEHNISNIFLAVNVSISLGITLKEIKNGIEKMSSIPHRLEVLKGVNGVTIIDDSYNCSVEGSKASLKILSKFEGKKIVITPGIIELGQEQYSANFDFGKSLANVCDYVVIDSAINLNAIKEGLLSENYDKTKIIIATSLTDAVEKINQYITSGDVILFENDLPDNMK